MTVRPPSGRSKGHADLFGKVAKASPISFRGFLGLREQPLARFEPLPVKQYPESIIHRFLQVLLAPEVTLLAVSCTRSLLQRIEIRLRPALPTCNSMRVI